jgi:hypothetical protein
VKLLTNIPVAAVLIAVLLCATSGCETNSASSAIQTASPSPPVVSGTPVLGKTLICSSGTSSASAPTLAYQWLRDGSGIAGAISDSYTVQADDCGHGLACQVTAKNTTGKTTTTSNTVRVAVRSTYVLEFSYSNVRVDRAVYRPSHFNVEADVKPYPPYEVLKNLHWASWTSTAAHATGTMRSETSGGTWLDYPASVWLSEPAWSGMYPTWTRVQPIRYFTHMRVETRLNGGQFVWKWRSGWVSAGT